MQYFTNVSYYNNDNDNNEKMVLSAQVGVKATKGLVYQTLKQEALYLAFIYHKFIGYLITTSFFIEFSEKNFYGKMHPKSDFLDFIFYILVTQK